MRGWKDTNRRKWYFCRWKEKERSCIAHENLPWSEVSLSSPPVTNILLWDESELDESFQISWLTPIWETRHSRLIGFRIALQPLTCRVSPWPSVLFRKHGWWPSRPASWPNVKTPDSCSAPQAAWAHVTSSRSTWQWVRRRRSEEAAQAKPTGSAPKATPLHWRRTRSAEWH